MRKCAQCAMELKDNDIVVVVLLARYQHGENAAQYKLEAFNQTILSHKECPKQETQSA